MEKRIHTLLDEVTFLKIFVFWMVIILVFGVIFFFLNQRETILVGQNNIDIQDAVYFSFVTAATIGYGDILPVGLGRLFSIIEGVLGLLIYGVVISKLVSYKQEKMLEQIYKISYEQKMNEIRSALYLFRTDITRAAEKANSGHWESFDFGVVLTALEAVLIDASKMLCKNGEDSKTDAREHLHLELVLHSISISLHRLLDLLALLKKKRIKWQNKTTIRNMKSITELTWGCIINCKRIKGLHSLEKVQMIGDAYKNLKPYTTAKRR